MKIIMPKLYERTPEGVLDWVDRIIAELEKHDFVVEAPENVEDA